MVPSLVEPAPTHAVHHLTCDQLCILWHQRLGQLHNWCLKLAAHAAIGLLDIGTEDELHKCPICNVAKLHKANKRTEDFRQATVCNQCISIDAGFIVAGFIVQSSKQSAPQLRNYERTYASCAKQPCQHLFFAVAASQNKIATLADTINAKEGQVPVAETRVGIDRSETWEGNRSSAKEGPSHCMDHCVACPTSQSLQPGSGDSNYTCLDPDWPCDVYHEEDSCLPCDPMIPPREFVIPLGWALQGHPEACALWEQMANSILKNPDLSFKATTHETAKDGVTSLQLLQGPVEGTKERSVPQATMGFSYQQVLGELIYGNLVCCLGFAVTFLAHFVATPALGHYQALESTCKHLWATNDLLHVKAPDIMHDSMLPIFPQSKLGTIIAYVDTSYAVDLKTWKSVTGLSACNASGCTAHKSKLQVTVATSSIKAEFIATVSTVKIIKYLCYVLQELEPMEPELMQYIGSQAAMCMINEWHDEAIHKAVRIPGIINPSDAATKALASQLHQRHVRQLN
jgi:hypothetical protein